MALELKSDLLSQQSPSILKGLAFGVGLWLFGAGGFGATSLFFLIALALYLSPFFRTARLFPAFLMVVIGASLAMRLVVGFPSALLLIFWSGLFIILLAIKNFSLIRRDFWQRLFSFSLVYALSIMYFSGAFESWIFAAFYYFSVIAIGFESARGRLALGLLFGFCLVELSLILPWLPLGPFNSASVITIFLYGLSELVREREPNEHWRRRLLTVFSVMATLLLVIFGVTAWRLPTP